MFPFFGGDYLNIDCNGDIANQGGGLGIRFLLLRDIADRYLEGFLAIVTVTYAFSYSRFSWWHAAGRVAFFAAVFSAPDSVAFGPDIACVQLLEGD